MTSAPIARYGTLQASIKLLHAYAALLATERDIQEGRYGTAGDIQAPESSRRVNAF